MGFLKWLGLGKKTEPSNETVKAAEPSSSNESDIAVYGTDEATRCVNLRELLKRNAYAFRDIRVDNDMGARAWLQRTTGDDGLPKLFIGAEYIGGFETVQAMIMDGTFQQKLDGDMDENEDAELARLKGENTVENLVTLLKGGEILTVDENGSETDVWTEPFARPPVVYYEGSPEPLDQIHSVVERILERVNNGEITISWKDED
jgi:glutaredoxin-related protein